MRDEKEAKDEEEMTICAEKGVIDTHSGISDFFRSEVHMFFYEALWLRCRFLESKDRMENKGSGRYEERWR